MCDYPCHHVISEQLRAQCSQALSLFHAYIGCDLPSSLFSIVKKWMKYVVRFSLSPWPKTQPALSPIPRIWHVWNTGLCWCRPKTVIKPLSVKPVSEARKWLSTNGQKSSDSIPPAQHALFQHANMHWWSLLSQRCEASWSHCMRLGMAWQDQGMGTLLGWVTWH